MKTSDRKILLAGLFLLVVIGMNSVTTFADGRKGPGEENDLNSEVTEIIRNMINEQPVEKKPCEVRIYNSELELIRFGTENSEFVRSFVRRADLLTEIDGIKYYRLNR